MQLNGFASFALSGFAMTHQSLHVVVLRTNCVLQREGGMRTADDKRRRTPGGVFLKLLADEVGDATLKPIFAENNKVLTKIFHLNCTR